LTPSNNRGVCARNSREQTLPYDTLEEQYQDVPEVFCHFFYNEILDRKGTF